MKAWNLIKVESFKPNYGQIGWKDGIIEWDSVVNEPRLLEN
jgi:hypothetical protein